MASVAHDEGLHGHENHGHDHHEEGFVSKYIFSHDHETKYASSLTGSVWKVNC